MNWKNIGKGDWTVKKGNRVFRLKRDAYGVLGIGDAYYLTTKLDDESDFKSVVAICINGDNHGKDVDVRLKGDKQYFVFEEKKHLEQLFKIVEQDYIETLY